MKKIILACIVSSTFGSTAVFAEQEPGNNLKHEASKVTIMRNTENENVANYIEAGMRGNPEDAQEAAQAIVKDIQSGEISEEQVKAMQTYSLNKGSSSGDVSMLTSVVTDAAKSMDDAEVAAFNEKHGTDFESGQDIANAAYQKGEEAAEGKDFDAPVDAINSNRQEIRQNARQSSPEREDMAQAFADQASNYSGKMEDMANNANAVTHATVNARPVNDEGFAIGAGAGFAGDSEAISAGMNYGFDNGVSVSGTITATSETETVDTDVSAGAGITYSFK